MNYGLWMHWAVLVCPSIFTCFWIAYFLNEPEISVMQLEYPDSILFSKLHFAQFLKWCEGVDLYSFWRSLQTWIQPDFHAEFSPFSLFRRSALLMIGAICVQCWCTWIIFYLESLISFKFLILTHLFTQVFLIWKRKVGSFQLEGEEIIVRLILKKMFKMCKH